MVDVFLQEKVYGTTQCRNRCVNFHAYCLVRTYLNICDRPYPTQCCGLKWIYIMHMTIVLSMCSYLRASFTIYNESGREKAGPYSSMVAIN